MKCFQKCLIETSSKLFQILNLCSIQTYVPHHRVGANQTSLEPLLPQGLPSDVKKMFQPRIINIIIYFNYVLFSSIWQVNDKQTDEAVSSPTDA